MNTGSKLKQLRENRNLSQRELAEAIGDISQVSIGKWEQGKSIKHKNIKKLANFFEVPYEELLDEEKKIKIIQKENDNSIGMVGYVNGNLKIETPQSAVEGLFSRIDKLITILEKK